MKALIDMELVSAMHNDRIPPGPYVVPPTIPAGMTVDEYRRRRFGHAASAGRIAKLSAIFTRSVVRPA